MALAPDIPAPSDALNLLPPEREILANEKREWGLLNRLRKLYFRSKLSRRRLILKIVKARGTLAKLSADELRAKAVASGKKLTAGPLTIDNLADVMMFVDEALFRARGFRFHDTQLQAGLLLSTGHILEMATGEGKTLTATLPAAVHGLAGCSVHVVTVNDYLAERDAREVMPILKQLGLSVGCVTHDMEPSDKKNSYSCDVTYCANKELVFDYLRERARIDRVSPLAYRLQLSGIGQLFGQNGPLLSRLDFVIIDEADSVLIDEANIPLILTEPGDEYVSTEFVRQAIDLVENAPKAVWEAVDALGYRTLRPEALTRLIKEIKAPAPEWKSLAIAEEMISKAMLAQDRFKKDVHYIVVADKIILIDPQTGRPTPDRTLQWGVQQVIEYREGLEISPNRSVIAKQSFQNFFRRYHKLAGMSGTIREVKKELSAIYSTPIAQVPTHRRIQREPLEYHLFETTRQKLDWATARIVRFVSNGRSVLIGVSSVLLSEKVSNALSAAGLQHAVLNARRLDEEADIVASAGQPGRVTVVTNMAGRGTDIKLQNQVKDAGGLHVIILDTLETSRLERQLYGRAGRQGDPGSYDIAHSLDEHELNRIVGKVALKMLTNIIRVYKPLASRIYFPYLENRRNRLENHRRKRRMKLINSEEKRNELLAFTRAE